jgi:hypothetical protein
MIILLIFILLPLVFYMMFDVAGQIANMITKAFLSGW